MNKITISFGSLFGSLTPTRGMLLGLPEQWEKVGSNHRPLACRTGHYGRWTWLNIAGVASTSNDRSWTWPGAARCL